MPYLITLAISYLLGSIPFGLVLTHLAGLGDIRTIGSGNIGATNVLRTGNKKIAALTLLLDGSKGAAAVLIFGYIYPGFGMLAGLAALLGHLYPVWLKFKGGKGVATTLGVMTALSWPVGLITIAVWLLVAKFFRYSSLAALIAFGIMPIITVLAGRDDIEWLVLVMTALVYWKHRANVARLIAGRESKIGQHINAVPPPE
jgi:glycerol-3-phosphate acyltransferase PlsY